MIPAPDWVSPDCTVSPSSLGTGVSSTEYLGVDDAEQDDWNGVDNIENNDDDNLTDYLHPGVQLDTQCQHSWHHYAQTPHKT